MQPLSAPDTLSLSLTNNPGAPTASSDMPPPISAAVSVRTAPIGVEGCAITRRKPSLSRPTRASPSPITCEPPCLPCSLACSEATTQPPWEVFQTRR
ncbi:hypothetical protein D9M71_463140 [compost metagenome]